MIEINQPDWNKKTAQGFPCISIRNILCYHVKLNINILFKLAERIAMKLIFFIQLFETDQ